MQEIKKVLSTPGDELLYPTTNEDKALKYFILYAKMLIFMLFIHKEKQERLSRIIDKGLFASASIYRKGKDESTDALVQDYMRLLATVRLPIKMGIYPDLSQVVAAFLQGSSDMNLKDIYRWGLEKELAALQAKELFLKSIGDRLTELEEKTKDDLKSYIMVTEKKLDQKPPEQKPIPEKPLFQKPTPVPSKKEEKPVVENFDLD